MSLKAEIYTPIKQQIMRKIFSIFAASLMLFAASCSTEKFDEPTGDGNVTFTVQLPGGLQSRALGDGTTATKLYVAAYEAGTTAPLAVANGAQSIADMSSLKATVSLQLVTGKTYDLVFWAQAADAPYAFNPTGRTVDMNYSGAAANAENRDAFFHIENGLTVTGPMEKDITLKRPFAQLNFVTADYNEAKDGGIEATKTSVKVKNLKPTLSLVDGKATGTAAEVEFTTATRPTETMRINGNTYDYLAMNYLLIDDTRDVVECEMTAYDAADANDTRVLAVSSVPVQRNYRTNIYGNLLTSTTTYNVTIDPVFETPDNNYSLWDGVTTTAPTADPNGVYHITSAAEFMYLVNSSSQAWGNYYTKSYVLEADIDLNGSTINGFGNESSAFAGKFDGNGHTVSNYTINREGKSFFAGLFNYCGISSEGYIKNLTVKNATVIGDAQVGSIVGGSNDGFVVDNCKAIGCTVSGFEQVGGVVGYQVGGQVINCRAENCFISYSEAAQYQDQNCQVLGFDNTLSGQTPTGQGNTYENVTITVNAVPAGTAEELKQALSTLTSNGTVVLTKNIDLTGTEWDVTVPWSPSSTTVTIDGRGYTIKGLKSNGTQGGLLGKLSTNGNVVIKDLNLENVEITGVAGDGEDAGGALIGWYENHGGFVTIENIHVKNVKASNFKYSGGLIGYTSTYGITIQNCSVDGTEVNSINHVGGLIGYCQTNDNQAFTIQDCELSNLNVKSTNSSKGREGDRKSVV